MFSTPEQKLEILQNQINQKKRLTKAYYNIIIKS